MAACHQIVVNIAIANEPCNAMTHEYDAHEHRQFNLKKRSYERGARAHMRTRYTTTQTKKERSVPGNETRLSAPLEVAAMDGGEGRLEGKAGADKAPAVKSLTNMDC